MQTNIPLINELYNCLAEIEDKIENRMLVELPCKVGDQVFVVYGYEIQHIGVYSMKTLIKNNHRASSGALFLYYPTEHHPPALYLSLSTAFKIDSITHPIP